MKILKSRIFLVILTAVICISGSVYATIKLGADEVSYKDTTIDNALDELYIKANATKVATQVATLTTQGASYTMQNDGYILGTAQTSNNGGFWISYDDNNDGSHMVANTVSSDNNIRNISLYAPKGTTVYTRQNYGTYNLTVYEWK